MIEKLFLAKLEFDEMNHTNGVRVCAQIHYQANACTQFARTFRVCDILFVLGKFVHRIDSFNNENLF